MTEQITESCPKNAQKIIEIWRSSLSCIKRTSNRFMHIINTNFLIYRFFTTFSAYDFIASESGASLVQVGGRTIATLLNDEAMRLVILGLFDPVNEIVNYEAFNELSVRC